MPTEAAMLEQVKKELVMKELKKRGMNRKRRRDWYKAHHAEVKLTKKEDATHDA